MKAEATAAATKLKEEAAELAAKQQAAFDKKQAAFDKKVADLEKVVEEKDASGRAAALDRRKRKAQMKKEKAEKAVVEAVEEARADEMRKSAKRFKKMEERAEEDRRSLLHEKDERIGDIKTQTGMQQAALLTNMLASTLTAENMPVARDWLAAASQTSQVTGPSAAQGMLKLSPEKARKE